MSPLTTAWPSTTSVRLRFRKSDAKQRPSRYAKHWARRYAYATEKETCDATDKAASSFLVKMLFHSVMFVSATVTTATSVNIHNILSKKQRPHEDGSAGVVWLRNI